MTFREFTGKNVEEAIRTAMKEFEADLGDLDIEILSQGSRGILGVGGEEARILAAPKSAVESAETIRAESPTVADTDADVIEEPQAGAAAGATVRDAPAEAPGGEGGGRTRGGRGRGGRGRDGRDRDREAGQSAGRAVRDERSEAAPRGDRPARGRREARGDDRGREPAPFVSGKPIEELSEEERSTLETAKSVLEEMLKLMGVDGTVEVQSGGETTRLNVKGEDLGALIGRRGEKLASLQHIVNLIAGRREGQHRRVSVDVENYRGRREQQLRDVAERAAKRVIQTGKIIQLEAMPAAERRVVHMALLENPKIRTQSVGVEPNRRIVVLPASQVRE